VGEEWGEHGGIEEAESVGKGGVGTGKRGGGGGEVGGEGRGRENRGGRVESPREKERRVEGSGGGEGD